jgi:hypothetical protein
MNYRLLRYACAVLMMTALTLGICPVLPSFAVQGQDFAGDELQQNVTPGSTVFALATNPGLNSGAQRLVSFEATSPGTLRTDVRITGLQSGETLKGIDFRPATGELFALGSTSRVYRLDAFSGVATAVAGAFTPPVNAVSFFGFDFNPSVDRIRVVSGVDDQNLRLNPITGAVAGVDMPIVYAPGDINEGDLPNVVGSAYTNNGVAPAPSPQPTNPTTLYSIDARAEGSVARLVTQGGFNGSPSPNLGQLFTVANITETGGAPIQTNNNVGFDIATASNTAYVSFTAPNPFDAPSNFYTLDLGSGRANFVGMIGGGNGLVVEGLTVALTRSVVATSSIQFSPTTYRVTEGVPSVTVTVTRTGDTSGVATIEYSSNDTEVCAQVVPTPCASERSDYIAVSGRLTFAAGETSKTITILINDDVFDESAETFDIRLRNVQGASASLEGSNATITITDNDTGTATFNPIDERDFFVRQQYRDFLNRDPDAAGFNFWTSQYDQRVGACNSITNTNERARCVLRARASISAAFFLSIEFQQTGYLVYRTYDVAFARLGVPRPPRGAGVVNVALTFREFLTDTQTISRDIIVNNQLDATQLEANRRAFFRDFVQRPGEFQGRFPTGLNAEQYVNNLFNSANITPTTAERNAAIAAYNSGDSLVESRARGLRAVVENEQLYQREFNRSFVILQYFGYLRRDPDLAGYNFWLNKLDAASTSEPVNSANVSNDPVALRRIQRAEMIEAFISSCEYQRRFGIPTTSPDDRAVNVTCAAAASQQAAFVVTGSNSASATNNFLARFDNTTASALATAPTVVAITGLQSSETLVGIDFRPANGQLYGVGTNSRIYTINTTTGAATFVAALSTPLQSANSYGVDFNPVADRLRVVNDGGQNLRINPDTGATTVDGNTSTSVYAAAYTNNFAGAISTTLYAVGSNLDNLPLFIQNPPNDGTLVRVGNTGLETSSTIGFDISASNRAFLLLPTMSAMSSSGMAIYSLNLDTGAPTFVGGINLSGTAGQVRGFALALPVASATP